MRHSRQTTDDHKGSLGDGTSPRASGSEAQALSSGSGRVYSLVATNTKACPNLSLQKLCEGLVIKNKLAIEGPGSIVLAQIQRLRLGLGSKT